MKRLLYLKWVFIAIILSIAITSCSDDKDGDIDNPEEQIVGKWINYNDAYGDPWDSPCIMVFRKDGTGYKDFEWYESFRYSLSGTSLRITWDEGETNTYTIRFQEKGFILYGYDDDDMSVLYFEKQ